MVGDDDANGKKCFEVQYDLMVELTELADRLVHRMRERGGKI